MKPNRLLGCTAIVSVLLSTTSLFAATGFPSSFDTPKAEAAPAAETPDSNSVVVESHPADMPEERPAPEFKPVPEEENIAPKPAVTEKEEAPPAPVEDAAKPVPLSTDETAAPVMLGTKNDDTARALTPAPSTATNEEALPADLRDALTYVYDHHPQLMAGRESLKATREQISLAYSNFQPSVYADYSVGRERQKAAGTRVTDNVDGKGLTLSQPLFNGFSSIAGVKSARQRVEAAEADLTALEQQMLYNVIITYTGVAEAQAVLELNQNNVDVLTKQRDATQVRFDVGELTKTDVAQAEARLASAKAAEQQSVGDLAIARADFMRAVGIASPEKTGMPGVPANLPKDLNEASSLARAASPVINAAEHREKAFASDINIRRGDILPDVTLDASTRRNDGGSFTGNRDSDAVTLNLTIPLYQSGAEWARLRESQKLASQARFNTMDTLLAVDQDVTSAWQNYVTSESVITSTQSAVDAATTALDGVRQESEFGVRTVLDVLDAEQELLNSKVNLVRASRNHKIQAYRLLASVGKLTAKELNLPAGFKE